MRAGDHPAAAITGPEQRRGAGRGRQNEQELHTDVCAQSDETAAGHWSRILGIVALIHA